MTCLRPRRPTIPLLLLTALTACAADSPDPAREVEPPDRVTADATSERPRRLEIGHVLGSREATLTVVEFSDFGCPSCADFARESLPALRRQFVESGAVRWRYVPIRQGFYRGGEAGRAAECAAEQERFWEMHDLLLERQREWQTGSDPRATFARYAGEIGAAEEAFTACYDSERPDSTLRLHDMVALSMGIRGIPVFLVGRRRVIGALEAERFAQVIREQLED